ncbi:Abi family protein [Bradyrhizobium sp. AUGA SZCCT0176]|uniref:Abi family protein n=1 Tax=Bradyrhizobium sp. AUGA SZCCT0176 TaxID=2807664 RepID=UPI001BAA9567|nr:Abi family protein [Bradyrhizobium sp. AUGA SZCCT0176]MBR1225231.1 Abi family protein [Bradyrhizobium sp. AUGA SZCCT0176]
MQLHDLTTLMAERGLTFDDWAGAHEHLEHIGYYRLTGYLYQFKTGDESFLPGTTFESVHDRYIFDRKLRLLIIEAVEKIEIAARVSISDSLALKHGAHWYLNRGLFGTPNWFYSKDKAKFDLAAWHARFVEDSRRQIEQSHQGFIKHYYKTYADPEMPPCWMVFEIISFGSVSNCFKFLKSPEVKETCRKFALNHHVLSSWLHSMSYVRNLCAHHSRLWNHQMTIKPIVPADRRMQFNGSQNERIYASLLTMQILLQKIWKDNGWAEQLSDLVDASANLPMDEMGFPANWKARKEWGFIP